MPNLLTLAPTRTAPADPPLPTIDDITRRDLLKGVGALGAGWVLAGCGTDGDPTAAGTTGGDTRTIDHARGTSTVPSPRDASRSRTTTAFSPR